MWSGANLFHLPCEYRFSRDDHFNSLRALLLQKVRSIASSTNFNISRFLKFEELSSMQIRNRVCNIRKRFGQNAPILRHHRWRARKNLANKSIPAYRKLRKFFRLGRRINFGWRFRESAKRSNNLSSFKSYNLNCSRKSKH
jgi:hypothetical protein